MGSGEGTQDTPPSSPTDYRLGKHHKLLQWGGMDPPEKNQSDVFLPLKWFIVMHHGQHFGPWIHHCYSIMENKKLNRERRGSCCLSSQFTGSHWLEMVQDTDLITIEG